MDVSVVSKDKMHENQDKETSTDEVQTEYKRNEKQNCGGRFCAPLQTSHGAHPASYTKGTGSFLGVKRLGRGVNHQPHLALRLTKE
jgi:hypothetical protein